MALPWTNCVSSDKSLCLSGHSTFVNGNQSLVGDERQYIFK